MPVGITVWRVRIGMFNSVSLFVINGQSVSSELLKSVLLLLIHCYRIIIISLVAIPLTLAIESLLVNAESAFFLFVGIKRAESNNSSCFKIIYCCLHALLLASISFISWASQVLYHKRKFAKSTKKIIKVIRNQLVFLPEDNEDHQGIALDEFIESNALFQLIDQPTHILENSKSCIDLIITNQPSLFVEFGVYPSLFRGCHHEIIFGKVAVSVPHPPPYKRRMWDYKVADVSSTCESLMNIDWYFEFGDLEPNLMVEKFTEIILSIIAENVPNRVITINEKDPPWITKNSHKT